MKNFAEINRASTGAKKTNQLFEKLWEHSRTLRRVGLVLVMCLITITQMWAAKGFFSSGQWNIEYYYYGDKNNWGDNSGYGNDSYIDLGIKTTLYLKGSWVKTWSDNDWTQSEVCWYVGFTNESMTYQNKVTKSSVKGNQTWQGFGINYDLIANAPVNPGPNTVYMYWRLDDYVSTSTSRILYTIPGFTTTSTSQTFDNTAVSSTNDKTISFGTHYGTALTTGNCSITGTNSSEFTVRSITESGVTVRFSPITPGNKSATLTITDAHGKTCTISLSGKTKHTVTYHTDGKNSGLAPSDATQYEYNTTVTVKDNTGLMTHTGDSVFAGWATSSSRASSGTIDYDPASSSSNTFSITQDMNLYPVWKDGYYLITPGGTSFNLSPSTPFITGRSIGSGSAVSVNGISSAYWWNVSSAAKVAGVSYSASGHLLYDTQTDDEDIYVYARGTGNLHYAIYKEGVAYTAAASDTVAIGTGKVFHFSIQHSYKSRLVISAGSSTPKIINVKVVKNGGALAAAGEAGYQLSFPGRAGTAKEGSIDGITLKSNSNLTFGTGNVFQPKTTGSHYAQFTTTGAIKLQVTTTDTDPFYVCTNVSNPSTTGVETGGSADTHSVDLSVAGTYYITSKGSNQLEITKIAFAAITSCTAPSALVASSITSSGATFTVTDANDANNYEIYVNTTGSAPSASTAASYTISGSKTIDVDDLVASTDYYAWVRTKCDYLNKSSWVALTGSYFTTSAAGCSATAPGTISKGTLSGCSITLTASGSAASNNTWYWQASADGTSTSESGATKDVTAPGTYYIRSFYSTGSCWSDAESYTITASDLTPAAPSALAATSPTAKGVTLTVTDAANTNDYEFYVNTSSSAPEGSTPATHSVTSGKSITITNLYAGTTFYAWARAKCGSNKSAWTALTDDKFTTSTVTMTHTLTNVTHTSGATSGIGGSDYTAVFTANTGYSMPNPTVTIGGNAATIVTDYTWSVEGAVGTITIPVNKINGNIVITLNSAAAAPSSVAISGGLLYFAGETIELTATPTGGNGPVTYQWYKGGKENVNAIKGATSATYTKASCAFGDAGSYYCKVTCGGSQSTWGQSGNAYDVKIPRLYVKTGHYYDLEKSDFGNVDFTRATASTATASIVLGSNGDYCFNIADGCGHYYGNSGTMQYNNTGWITNVSPQDCGLTTTNAGTYIFTINYSTWSQLTTTITFPSCTDPGLAFASASKSVTLCDDAPTNALTNTHGVTVSYASSDETVATVASDGTLTIKKAGTTTITASSLEQTVSAVTYCADNASYTLTVNASTAAGLAYGTSTIKKDVGDDAFTNTLTNSNSLSVTYSSSDEDVATVASDGTVTIKAAGTTTITASSAQQKVSSTCYAEGEASYTLTVYPVYTVTYNAMGGTCSPTSTNTTTALGKVTLPSATHASYTTYSWVTSDGTEAGDAGDTYTPEGNINLYAKWSGSCAGGGGSGSTIFKARVKTSGMTSNKSAIEALSSNTSLTTDNYLSELSGGTLTLALTAAKASVPNDSTISLTDNGKAYLIGALSGTTKFQAGDIITVGVYNQAGYIQKTSGSYSALTDISVAKGTTRTSFVVPTSLIGENTFYIKGGSNGMYFAYVEVYRPGSVLFFAEVDEIASAADLGTSETEQTTSTYLASISGGKLYTKGSAANYAQVVTTHEISLSQANNNTYIKLTLDKKLAEGDKIIINTSTPSKPFFITTEAARATTNAAPYTIPAESGMINQQTIYLWRNSSTSNLRSIAIVRHSGGTGTCKTVTYHGNGATSGYTNDPTQYAASGTVTVLANGFTKTGYAFAGWNTKADGSGATKQPGATFAITQDTTLHAQWKQIKYFTGAASTTSWNTDGNWSPSGVPAITDPVVIQANVTVDTDEAKALSVDIESGNTLTIGASKALIIKKTLTKAGGATEAADVIINSTRDEGVGALIIGGETGTNKATVNFETRVKRESGTGNWINQFIGSPFSDLEPYVDYALQIYEFRPAGGGNRGFWHKLSSGDGMEAFWGYNVLYNDNDYLDVQWTGTLNASSNNVTKTGSNEVQTDNLFANSWVAPIHIAAFEEGDFTNFDPTIYIFNAGTPQQEQEMSSDVNANTAAGTYATIPINSSSWLDGTLEVIPAMQAFFVKATGASPSIKLDYSKLVYTPALTSVDITPTRAPRRSAELAPEVIRLHVASENGWAENTYVLGREDFTEGYDRGWDGRYMEGEDTNPQLYTPTTDGYMAVNCVPEIEGTVVGFRKGSSDNNYIFSFDYNGDEVWYLNDQKAQKSTQIMKGQTYAFESEAGDNAARFVISATPINKIATGCESVGAEAAKVRKVIIDDKVYIIRGGQVFDVLGKTIKK